MAWNRTVPCAFTNKTCPMKIKFTFPIAIPSALLIVLSGCSDQEKEPTMEQPQLGSRTVRIIETENLQFKDLNDNGVLDPYEDWRLSPKERSLDLLGRMTLEEKAGMLLIADMRMTNETFMLDSQGQSAPVTTEFNETDIVLDLNQSTGEPVPHPVMNTVGTTKGITEHEMRRFIWRTPTSPAGPRAIWANKVQALAEGDRLGI